MNAQTKVYALLLVLLVALVATITFMFINAGSPIGVGTDIGTPAVVEAP